MPTPRPQGSVQYDNSGRVAIVTGGCSGIGLAICQGFLETKTTGIVALDVNEEAAKDLPAGIEFLHCDTSDEAQCKAAVDWTVERFGGVDVLVNNAAIQPKSSYKPLHELETDVWERLVAINFSGYTYMGKYVLAQMKAQGSGVVVNIASAQGHRTAREVPAYGPVKAGNLMQARQWGVEYARDGIRVVSVSPGAIDTPMVRASLEEQGGETALANRHPQGRLGRPAEIAQAVLWLSSPDASFVTATDLEVDGGLGAFASFADPYPMSAHD